MAQQKQTMALTDEVSQQLMVVQARFTAADLANMDLCKEINVFIQTLIGQISNLQKENAELKAKQEKV
jgi:hypothetical protein